MSEPEALVVRLALAVACSACQQPQPALLSGACPDCGTPLDPDAVAAVRDAIRQRRDAFRRRLQQLAKRMHSLTDPPLVFARRGTPRNDNHHLVEVLQPAFGTLRTSRQTVAELLATGTWAPEEHGTVAAFNALVQALDAALDYVTTLRTTMPPIGWRAVHRELTRAAAEQARGNVLMALTITAPDLVAARRQSEASNQAFATGTRHVERVAALINRIRQAPRDGPFQLDGSLDIAALTWSSTGQKGMSIADGATIVREAFADIPGMSSLPDEHALMLLPTLASSARAVDLDLLIRRAQELRKVLDDADRSTPWITDHGLLISRLNRGGARLMDEAERIGREWRHQLPRRHIMNTLTEVYRQLIEGALRDLGGAVVVAARGAARNATYQQDVVDGMKAGKVVDELRCLGVMREIDVDMVYRNASAHADIEVTDTGIVATERVIENDRVKSSSTMSASDEEFYEDLVALQELLMAMQLAVLPWLWLHTNTTIAAAVASAPADDQQRAHILALLAGMSGLRDVVVSVDEDLVTVSATPNHAVSLAETARSALSIAPGALGAVPSAGRVRLNIDGLVPVTFTRTEFRPPAVDDEAPHELPLLGLVNAKWLIDSGAGLGPQEEAKYVTWPLALLASQCADLVVSTPPETENIDSAITSLRIFRTRLDEVMPINRSSLTQRAVTQIDILTASLRGLAQSRRGQGSATESLACGQQAVAALESMKQIQAEATAMFVVNSQVD
ncbi:hypothetical protein F0L68_38780 [Solihabitans fulvus]|uniref:Uncharacterized protein n=1 Tax=Solihabitans fulvus TaxID=1892852 RepID=A0A5B2WJS1_9PSEU|nr:hypothetical protein [Solihabitans fulvus]KAA2250706.1 hypothetical protein F0L68_38780 [Solihabitans fulvus]